MISNKFALCFLLLVAFTSTIALVSFTRAESEEVSSQSTPYSYAALTPAEKEQADAVCAEYTRCSECVYDATSVVMNRRTTFNCIWCPKTGKCAADLAPGSCPSNRTLTHNAECDDMQCAGAKFSGNIYMCRPGMVFAIIFSVFLIIISAVYALWYRVIQQGPWRYDNLDNALNRLCETHGGAWNASQKAARPEILSADPIYVITKKEQKRSTYDEWAFGSTEEERFWTNVKRYAFFPLAVGLLTGVISTVLLFTSSIRPFFADPYYALVLIFGYGSIGVMVLYVRLFQPIADAGGVPETWINLAMFLRGRSIEKAFPIELASDKKQKAEAPVVKVTSPGGSESTAAAAASYTANWGAQKRGDHPQRSPLFCDTSPLGAFNA